MINVQISEQDFKEIQLKNYSRSLERIKRYPSDTDLGFEIESLLESEVMDDLGPGKNKNFNGFGTLFFDVLGAMPSGPSWRGAGSR